jgi:hypothetical protein
MDDSQIRLLEPRAEYDQFLLGSIDLGNENPSTVYDLDAILLYLIAEYLREGIAEDEEDAQIMALEHYEYNMLQCCPPHILFLSRDQLSVHLQDHGEAPL